MKRVGSFFSKMVTTFTVLLLSQPASAISVREHTKLLSEPDLKQSIGPVGRPVVSYGASVCSLSAEDGNKEAAKIDLQAHMRDTALCAAYAMVWATVGKHANLSSLTRDRIPKHVDKALDAIGVSVTSLIAFLTAERFKTACTTSIMNVVGSFAELGTALKHEKESYDNLRNICAAPEEYSKCYQNAAISKGANTRLVQDYLYQTTIVYHRLARAFDSQALRKAATERTKALTKRLALLDDAKNQGIRDLIFDDVHDIGQKYCFTQLCTPGHPPHAQQYKDAETIRGVMMDVQTTERRPGASPENRYWRMYPTGTLSGSGDSYWRWFHGNQIEVGRLGNTRRTFYLPASTPEEWTERWLRVLATIEQIQACQAP